MGLGFEEPWFFICRSWTGNCIYPLLIRGDGDEFLVVESWVNRDPSEYKLTDIKFDHELALRFIDSRLLGKEVVYPKPDVS